EQFTDEYTPVPIVPQEFKVLTKHPDGFVIPSDYWTGPFSQNANSEEGLKKQQFFKDNFKPETFMVDGKKIVTTPDYYSSPLFVWLDYDIDQMIKNVKKHNGKITTSFINKADSKKITIIHTVPL